MKAPTQTAASRKLKQKQKQELSEQALAAEKARVTPVTVTAFEWWERTNATGRWQETTAATYRRGVLHKLAGLKKFSLSEEAGNPRMIRAYIAGVAKSSPGRAGRIRTILRQTFSWAAVEGLIAAGYYPASQVPLPRVVNNNPEVVPTGDLPGPLEKADRAPDFVSAGVRVMLDSGRQIGELLGLWASDSQDEAGSDRICALFVRGSVIHPDTGVPHRRADTAKTPASIREILIQRVAADALRSRVERHSAAGNSNPEALLFGARGGGAMSPANWRRAWPAARGAGKFAFVHPHTLRATYASLCFKVGRQFTEAVAFGLGHRGGTEVLFKHYLHRDAVDHGVEWGVMSPGTALFLPAAIEA